VRSRTSVETRFESSNKGANLRHPSQGGLRIQFGEGNSRAPLYLGGGRTPSKKNLFGGEKKKLPGVKVLEFECDCWGSFKNGEKKIEKPC